MEPVAECGFIPVCVPEKRKRKNLVIVAGGDASLHTKWPKDLPEDQRSWDLALTHYGDKPPVTDHTDLVVQQKGYKFDCVARMLRAWPWIFDYDYIWLCDDDIMTSWSDIQRMFDMMAEFRLDLAQPALSKDSYTAHNICCVRPEYTLRYTNFVEVMVPVFSSAALRTCQATMDISPTGLKMDWVWPKLLNDPRHSMAILDDVPVHHTREVGTSAMWDKIRAAGTPLLQQLDGYMRQIGVEPHQCVYKVYGYILKQAVSGLPQQRTFEYPMEKRLSRRITPLLSRFLSAPVPQNWQQAPLWNAPAKWSGGPVTRLEIPPLPEDGWCLSLGLTVRLDATNAGQTAGALEPLFYIGDTPETAQFALELVPQSQSPEAGYTLSCTARGQQKYAIRKGFSGVLYNTDCHISIQIYPQAGWLCIWVNHIPCQDVWCDPFQWYSAHTVTIGHPRIAGEIRDVWISPTPAEEKNAG